MGVEVSRLSNGLTVATETLPSIESVALGVWVKSGARNERDKSHGQRGGERRQGVECGEREIVLACEHFVQACQRRCGLLAMDDARNRLEPRAMTRRKDRQQRIP